MAARTRKTELDEGWRSRIRTTMLLERVQKHAFGGVKMTTTQLRAAEIVLRKTVPDLAAVNLSGEIVHTLDLGVLLTK